MKKTSTLNRLLSLALCLCMVLSLLPLASLNAFAADMTGGEVLYLKPNSNWAMDNARFAAYFYGDGDAWESMVPVDGADGIYEVTVPSGSWNNVIFCRMNPSTETNSWDNKWNQSGDLTYDGINNLCTIHDGQWDCGNNVTWSSYPESDEPACTHDSHSQDGKCTACGETVEHTYVDGSCACGAVIEYMRIYFQNNWMWTDVKLHYWGSASGNTEWPGTAMTLYGNDGYYDIYVLEVPTDIEGITISGTKDDGSGGLDKTPDITGGWYNGICYYMTWNDGNQASSEPINVILPRTITISMTDYYGDGWNGNAIEIYENGTLVDTATVEDGESATWTYAGDHTKTYSFRWVMGDYPEECAFEILFGEEVVFTATGDDCVDYADGKEIYTTCDHSYGEGVVTAPTCTEAGYTGYTCSVCGSTNIADEVAALGHSFGDDGICTVCGFDKNKVIIINMTDSYGDGWTDNAIAVYEDGTLVGIATVDVGESATWTYEREADKEYTFYWMGGQFSDECAFEILFGDEVVFTATEDDCEGYTDGQMVYPICEHSLGEDGKCVYCGTEVPFVAVGGVKLYDGNYLDTNGTVSSTQPDGGYAWYSDGVLTLHDYTYTGKGYVIEAVEMDGETLELTALVYTALDELSIQLEGANTLNNTGMGYGVCVGMADAMDFEMGTLVLSGTGTLNLTSYMGIAADYITLSSGIVNIDAFAGIDTPNGDSSLTVNSGELNVTASGDEYSEGIRIGDVVINGGKVIVSCDGYLALNVSTLTVNGGYLEVVQGGMEANHPDIDEPIALGNGADITAPEGATLGFYTGDYDIIYYTIYDADGNIADAFVIEGPDVEPGGDQEPFDVVVYNEYGMADTVTLSNPVAIPGEDYVTTVSSTVGTGIGVWGVYVAEDDSWVGNNIYEFDEETNTLTVFGDYVAAGMQIEVVPFVTLTTHMNGGSAMNDYWEHVFGPDETGTFTEEWAYGEEDYFFGAWDDEAEAILPDPNLVFKREGYTVVGYNTAADGSGTAYAVDALHKLTDDLEIYLIWEANSPINLESAALSFKEKIHYNIFFSLGIDENVELADMGLIMFDSLKADGTMEDAIATYSGAVEMNGMYMVATEGVHAKRMGDTIYFRVYAKLADGSYVYSKTVQYSAVTYAEHILSSDKSDSDKALVVAMLNYGAEAQMYFGYNTDSLANAGLTAEQKALVKDYQSDLLAPVAKPDSSKAGSFASTGTGFAKLVPAVSFEGSFVLNYFFTPSEAVVGDMTLYYWTEADYAAATELTAENATGSIVMQPGEQYRAILDGIHAKDADTTVYVAAVYSDGTATHCTGVLPYSIGAYLTSHAAKETNFQAMAQAAAVYCSYCKEYFGG